MEKSTRQELISSAQELMLARGYSATGIMDICKHAGVSKGAFYHSFDSKEHLAVVALNDYYRVGISALMAIDVSHAEPADRLIAFVDAVAEQAAILWERGCLIGGLATEMSTVSETLQQQVSAVFAEMAGLLAVLAKPFVARLEDESITAEEIGEHFLVTVEGSVVLSRAHLDPSRITIALRRFAAFLRALPRKT